VLLPQQNSSEDNNSHRGINSTLRVRKVTLSPLQLRGSTTLLKLKYYHPAHITTIHQVQAAVMCLENKLRLAHRVTLRCNAPRAVAERCSNVALQPDSSGSSSLT
jgi:hypothetical protein